MVRARGFAILLLGLAYNNAAEDRGKRSAFYRTALQQQARSGEYPAVVIGGSGGSVIYEGGLSGFLEY